MEQLPISSEASTSAWELWGRSAAMILVAGVCLSVTCFREVRSRELQNARDGFHSAAASSEYAVRREIESNLLALRTLRSFIEVTPDLTDAGFQSFAQDAARNNPSILSLEWAPRVTASERPAFERELRQRGIAHAYIRKAFTPNPAPATEAEEYFPIERMFPMDQAERILGYNLAGSALMIQNLRQAAQSRALVATGKIPVVETSHGGVAIPSYMAVLGGPPGHERLRGYALVLFQMGQVLEQGLRRLQPEAIDTEFYDLNATPGKRFLYRHEGSATKARTPRSSEEAALAAQDFKHIVRFDVGGRSWAMIMTATDEYKRASGSWRPWGAAAILMLLTAATMVFFRLHLRNAGKEAELRHLRSRKEAEDALRESEERYALAAQGSKDGLWDWSLLTGRVFYSERWKSMLGFTGDQIGHGPEEWTGRLLPGDKSRVEAELADHLAGRTSHFQSQHRIRHKDGSYRWVLSRGVAVVNADGVATRMAGSQTDITEDKTADPLTGLASRILVSEKLQLLIDHAHVDQAERFALLFIDLDRFKVINDSLGHMAGDQLLREIAQRLIDCVAAPLFELARITIARLGGDEFVVLIGGMSYAGMATALANRIQEAMEPAFQLSGHQVFVSASIGVRIGDGNATPETLMRDADTAMYHAKLLGKQRTEVFVPAMRFQAVERLRLETDLRKAISDKELVVYYQPKVCLATGMIAELEALVRWIHPELGMVAPTDFIPLADETGLIVPLGEYVLRTACAQLSKWISEGDGNSCVGLGMRVSVNLSCKQFTQPDLFERIMDILRETNLPPDRLSLEITEGVLMENIEGAILLLNRLRNEGIGLQIDDFGTGYSSLNYLHRLPVDALKIDQSFVQHIGVRPENAGIVNTIVMLGRTLGMSVVAEGVETAPQLALLMESGCEYAQGHLFCEAGSSETIERCFGGFADALEHLVQKPMTSSY